MPGGFDIAGLLPIVLLFVVMYFLIIRPQSKKAKDHQTMISNLKRGDRVVTSGGLIGVVTGVTDTELQIEIAEGVRVKVSKPMVSSLAGTEKVVDKPSKAEVDKPKATASKKPTKKS
jgi:preprotein translocase subunit YajC